MNTCHLRRWSFRERLMSCSSYGYVRCDFDNQSVFPSVPFSPVCQARGFTPRPLRECPSSFMRAAARGDGMRHAGDRTAGAICSPAVYLRDHRDSCYTYGRHYVMVGKLARGRMDSHPFFISISDYICGHVRFVAFDHGRRGLNRPDGQPGGTVDGMETEPASTGSCVVPVS